VGQFVPQSALPAMAAFHKYVNEPLQRLVEKFYTSFAHAGEAEAASIVGPRAKGPIIPKTLLPEGDPRALEGSVGPEDIKLANQAHPWLMSAARALSGTIGATVGDPRNLPFLASGLARPMLQKILAYGFAGQMSQATLNNIKFISDNWEKMTPEDRREKLMQSGVQALLTAASLFHAYGKLPEEVKARLKEEHGELGLPGSVGDEEKGKDEVHAPIWYSKAEKVVQEKLPGGASGDSVLAMLKNAGVKESEIAWLGLEEKLKGKPKVTRDEVLGLIRENGMVLEEKTLGGDFSHAALKKSLSKLSNERESIITYIGVKGYGVDRVHGGYDIFVPDPSEPNSGGSWVKIGSPKYSALPAEVRNAAYRLSEVDNERERISNLVEEGDPTQYGPDRHPGLTLPGEHTNYREMLIKLPQVASAEGTAPSETVAARYKAQWDDIIARKEANRAVMEKADAELNRARATRGRHGMTDEERWQTVVEYDKVKQNYRHALDTHNRIMDEQDKLHDKMVQETIAERTKPGRPTEPFKLSHWQDDPNVLAHTRFDDRTTVDGKHTLFLEEVQSDWHQKGKKVGYKGPEVDAKVRELEVKQAGQAKKRDEAIKEIAGLLSSKWMTADDWISAAKEEHRQLIKDHADSEVGKPAHDPKYRSRVEETWVKQNKLGQAIDRAEAADRSMDEYLREMNQLKAGTVPDAPFKSDWQELVIKRMLRYAAEKGYDSMSWVTGEQTADRYDLSKHVSRLDWFPADEEPIPTRVQMQAGYYEVLDQNGKFITNVYFADIPEATPTGALREATKRLKEKPWATSRGHSEAGKGHLYAYDPSGQQIISKEMDETDLPGVVGKEPAQKLLASSPYADKVTRDDIEKAVFAWQQEQNRAGSPRFQDDIMDDVKAAPMGHVRGDEIDEITKKAFGMAPEEWKQSYVHHTKPKNMRSISGVDLKVGGEWAKNLYDRAIPNFLRKYTKRWNAKVEEAEIPVGQSIEEINYVGPEHTLEEVQKMLQTAKGADHYYLSEVEINMRRGLPFKDAALGIAGKSLSDGTAEKWFGGKFVRELRHDTQKVHTIQITPEMKKSVLGEGQPIAQREGGEGVTKQLEEIVA